MTKTEKKCLAIAIVVTILIVGFLAIVLREPKIEVGNTGVKVSPEKILGYELITEKIVEPTAIGASTGTPLVIAEKQIVRYYYYYDELVDEMPMNGYQQEAKNLRQEKGRVFNRGVNWEETNKRNDGQLYFDLTAEISNSKLYHKAPDGEWYKIEGATTTPEEFAKLTQSNPIRDLFARPAFALTTSTISGAGDGSIQSSTSTYQSWDTAHDNAVGAEANYGGTSAATGVWKSGSDYIFVRSFWSFPSGDFIGATDIISSSSAHFWVRSMAGTYDINIVESTQERCTQLRGVDYNEASATNTPTELSTRVAATLDMWHDFLINNNSVVKKNGEASSCGVIDSSTGVTSFAIRTEDDMDDTPTAGSDETASIWTSEYTTDTSLRPKLLIDYTAATVDTCTAPTSGSYWNVELSDNCHISDSQTFDGIMNCFGTGSFVIQNGGTVLVESYDCPELKVESGGNITQRDIQ